MKILLYMDEDSMDHALVRALRARGVDVVTALDEGMVGRTDPDHLDYAAAEGRVLCTFNVGDFYRLHTEYLAQGKNHSGIVLMQQRRYSLGEHIRWLFRLVTAEPAESMKNRIEFLSFWGRYGRTFAPVAWQLDRASEIGAKVVRGNIHF